MNTKTRLLICDDHALVREGIKVTLGQQPTIEIVAEVCNGREAVAAVKRLRPDLVLMDMSMPELNGLEATLQIKEFDKDIKVLIMTMYDDEEVVMRCLAAGASGYILKDAPLPQLIYAIGMVTKGFEYLDPGVTRNTHTIRVEAEAARFTMTIEGVPSAENPRTGKLTTLSVLACLRGLVNTLKIGC